MATMNPTQQLRNTLRLNALTSLLGGLIAGTAAGPVDELLGTGHPGLVRLVGIGLMVFAADVALVGGARLSRLLGWTPAIVVADMSWVLACIATVAAAWYSTTGAIVVGGVAALVGFFAHRQYRTWRSATLQSKEAPLVGSGTFQP